MVNPSRDEFHALARDHTAVPVWTEVLADLTTPVAAFNRIVGAEPGFLLESAETGHWGRWSFVGRRPAATLTKRSGVVEVTGELPVAVDTSQGLLASLEQLLGSLRSPRIEGLPPFHGGLIGYIGYDAVRETEDLGPGRRAGATPDAVVHLAREVAAYDHWRQRASLVVTAFVDSRMSGGEIDASYDDACARLADLAQSGARPLEEPLIEVLASTDQPPAISSTFTEAEWEAAVATVKEHILGGDVFQVVLSQRFGFDLGADPLDLYRALRQINPSPYMYLLQQPEVTLVGSSPEPMVKVLDDLVVSRPIAGTRRRGRSEADDRRLAAELAEDPKERAEHVMLVDLARNDLGRISEFGSVAVRELMSLEQFSHVMHLTSQVEGVRRAGVGLVDVLRATLPAGTVSGAPKVRAMQLIDELEPSRRGPYAGVVGYLDLAGNLDTAIAIRTVVIEADGRASVQAGAGIVADSDPASEAMECRNKAAALLAAVPVARQLAEARQNQRRD